jgi:hypothetical protein
MQLVRFQGGIWQWLPLSEAMHVKSKQEKKETKKIAHSKASY